MAAGDHDIFDTVARKVANDLCLHEPRVVSGDVGAVAKVVAGAIADNFEVEAEIYREAQKAFAAMGHQTSGMDRTTLITGLAERIAKKRGFEL